MPQLALGAVLAPGGRGIPAHLRPGLGPARRLLGLRRLRDGRGELQPPQRGRAQRQRREPAPRQGALPLQRRVAPVKEGPGAPVTIAAGVPVTPVQPPDVHIYIGWIHTASIFIYIMDRGAKGAVPAVPAIPSCPCRRPPRGWILPWDTRSPREDGSRCGAALGGWILLWDTRSPCVPRFCAKPWLCRGARCPGLAWLFCTSPP